MPALDVTLDVVVATTSFTRATAGDPGESWESLFCLKETSGNKTFLERISAERVRQNGLYCWRRGEEGVCFANEVV